MTERVSEAAADGQQITPCRVGIPSFACRKPLLNEKMMSMFLNDTVAAAPRVQVPKRTSPRNQPSAKSSNKQAMTLTDFSDDILHQIYSFIPTIQNLRNFSQVNKRACQWMFGSKTTDPLFDAAYQRAFGETSCQTSGRKTWKELYRIRQCLSQAASGMNHQSELNTVGVLSLELESEAVGYDHPRHFRDGQCLGYFGMAQLFPRGDSPIAIWGDFNGIVIVPSIEALLSSDTLPTKSFQRIAGNSQVLCVLVSNVYYDPYENSTCFFLGYASGHVRVVKAMQEGDRYSYEVISTAQAHTDEVTALAILPFHNPCIASSSVDGTVIFYPNSIQGRPTLCSPAEACKTPNEKILCFGATRGEHGHVFLCTGSSEGVLTRWSPFDSIDFFKWKKTSSIPLGTVASAPTLLEFLHGTSDTIVVGTNSGSLLTYRMSLSLEAPLLCGFNPLKHEATAHIGAVESIKTVGNLLLTSGAHESHLMAWDIRTLSPVGSIMAHPGHLHLSTGSIFRCAVISVLVCREREALVTLYRDGNIREYSYSEASSDMRRVASDKAVQSFPPTILRLKSFMETADDSLSWRMRMRVIQAGLQNKKEPHSSFEGLDGVKYEDAKSSFDYFSGLSSCTICTQRGEGAFVCRVQHEHSRGLDTSPSADLFRKLDRTKRAWIMDGESTWLCVPCNVDNKIEKKRCFMCRRWKDGKKKRGKCDGTIHKRTSSKKVKKRSKPITQQSQSGPKWKCVTCESENEHGRKRCRSCKGWHSYARNQSTTKQMKSKRKSRPKKSDSIAMVPVECTVKITAGTAPGTVKMWECLKCDQLNHWKRYSCELCGRRAGGPVWDVTMSPSADNADTSSSSSLPCNEWVCHKCNTDNRGSSLCTACFASKNRRSFSG